MPAPSSPRRVHESGSRTCGPYPRVRAGARCEIGRRTAHPHSSRLPVTIPCRYRYNRHYTGVYVSRYRIVVVLPFPRCIDRANGAGVFFLLINRRAIVRCARVGKFSIENHLRPVITRNAEAGPSWVKAGEKITVWGGGKKKNHPFKTQSGGVDFRVFNPRHDRRTSPVQ